MKLRIATRQSPLALWQAHFVRDQLQAHYPQWDITCVPIVTQGDQILNQPLATIGGKGLFVKALQRALLNNDADIAVHCVKDMSVHEHPDLCLAAILSREEPTDAFISPHYQTLANCPPGSIIGTASPRRQSLLKHYHPTLDTALLRGNVNSRLEKCQRGDYAGILLATAGLKRLGLTAKITEILPTQRFIPAIGQGALAIECSRDNLSLIEQLTCLHEDVTGHCILAERAVNSLLGGDCTTPIGAYAQWNRGMLTLHAFVGDVNGNQLIHTRQQSSALTHAKQLGEQAAQHLIEQGAKHLLEPQ